MTRHQLAYVVYGLLANTALRLYMAAPRESLQMELFNLHRWALKRAHHARMRDPAERELDKTFETDVLDDDDA